MIVVTVLTLLAGAGFGGVYHWTIEAVRRDSQQIIAVEAQGLGEHYGRHGLPDVVRVVSARSEAEDRSLYLLTDRADRKLAGNLARWPQQVDELGVWRDFRYPSSHDGETEHEHGARAVAFQLPDGVRLLVGYDIEDEIALGRNLLFLGAAISALILLAGLTSGLVYTRSLRRRIAAIDQAGRDIMGGMIERPQGEKERLLPVSSRGDEFDDLAGSLNGMLKRIKDLMQRQRQLMRQQRQTTSVIAHDLRDPLTVLEMRLEAARDGPAESDTSGDILEAALKDVRRMGQTFNTLLATAKADIAREPVDLAEIARKAVQYYEFRAEDSRVALELQVEGEAPTVQAEPKLLERALVNLVHNALKYTSADGVIVVTVDADGIAVSDTGRGIPAEDRQRVLDPFTRLNPSHDPPGHGLGLALVDMIAARQGARLVLEDARPGEVPPGLRASLRWSG